MSHSLLRMKSIGLLKCPTGPASRLVSKVEAAVSPSRIRELLGSAGGLRDAVVLSEILGPPKSLRAREEQFR